MATFAMPHYMHVYGKPRQSNAWLDSFRVENYKHRIMARGGFDTASCSISVKPSEAEYIFSYYIGNVVRFFVDDPKAPIWEGYIERITYRVGGLVLTRSLENMANRVNVTFYNADSAAAIKTENMDTVTGVLIENTDSQEIYGVKMMNLDAGIHYNAADRSHKRQLQRTILTARAWPQISVASGSDSAPVIEIEMRGLHYMAWDWEQYQVVSATIPDATTALERLTVRTTSSILSNNAPYIVLTGPTSVPRVGAYRYIAVNTSFNISLTSQSGQTYLQFIQSIVEAGDGTQQYAYGILPPDANIGGLRPFYYQPANTAIAYQVNALRDTGRLRDTTGALVPGWLVRPDNGIQIMDVLIGYSQSGDDPRIGYMEAVEYDGETGLVSFQTGDNITMEGVLQKDRYFKAHSVSSRFGANLRQVL